MPALETVPAAVETNPEVASAPVAAETNGAAKPAKKAPAKKAAKAPVKKVAAAPKEKKSGLRKPQQRILKVLAKGKVLTRAQIAEKAPVDVAMCTEYLGSSDEAKRKANDEKHFPSLITLKLVKFAPTEEGAAQAYEITATGKKAAESL